MNIYEIIKADLEYQKKLKDIYESEVTSLPEGSLYIKPNTKEYYYIEAKTKRRTYISKDKAGLLDITRKSKICRIGIKRCEENIKVANHFLKKYKSSEAVAIYNDLPKAYKFENNISRRKQEMLGFEEGIVHMTSRGLKVRSKSEAIIVERLVAEDIEFDYEEELILKSIEGGYKKVLPDFTFTTSKGEKIYWEHFGLFKDRDYSKRSFEKMLLHAQNNILPGSNLFITADSFDGSIDVSSIYNTVKMIKGLL